MEEILAEVFGESSLGELPDDLNRLTVVDCSSIVQKVSDDGAEVYVYVEFLLNDYFNN